MKIILEGCDGTGKTTLAKILADKYRLDICHCNNTDPTTYDFYRQTIDKNNVVWDRHLLGELIYPAVFDRHQNVSEEQARDLVNYAKTANVKIFILTNDIESIRERLTSRGNECTQVLSKLEWINRQYIKYAKMFEIPLINTYDMTLGEIFRLCE